MRSLIVMAGVVALSIGCGGGGGKGGGNTSPAPAPPTPPNTPSAQVTVDHNGGQVTVNDPTSSLDGASVDIPVGALTQPTVITVNEAIANATPTGTLPVLLEPSGTIFTLPVTLRLPYTTQLVQTGDDQNDLMVLATSVGHDAEIDPAPQVGTSRLISTTTTHFSIFEVLFPRDYKLYRQSSMLFDSTPTTYEMGITRTSSSVPYIKTEYHPVLARGPSNLTVTLGKGTFADFFASNQGNVILIHGLMSSPTTFYFDANGQANNDDFLLAFRNDPAFQNMAQNVILYQYPSGWPVGTNAKALMNLITTYAKPGFRATIIAHSMGGIVARYAIERLDLSLYTEKLITLGTPHEGGQSSYFSAYFTGTHLGSILSGGVIPSLNDIVSGSALLNDPKDGLNLQFPGKKGSTEYFLVAGKQSPSVGDDGLVTVGSATSTYLQVQLNHQAIFDDVEHSELHTKARTNGVLMKIREWVTGQPNRAPAVDTGADQTVTVNTQVTLAGSATDADQDTLTYAWTQTAGPNVTLANANTATAMFTPTQTGTYTFTLTASDTVATGTDTVTITVVPGNGTPVANAGADRTVTIGVLVSLDGSGSSDPDNNPLTYRWIQMAGTSVVLSNAKTVSPTFVPSSADTYTFSLIVNDGNVDSAIDTVTITVNPPPINRATFYPVVDTYTGDQAYNSANPNRATLPSFLIGDDGAGQNFWGRVSFDPVSTIVPPNVTITKATFTLHEKTVWKNDTVSIEVGGGFWVYPQTGGSAAIDVTSEFQKLLTSPFAGLPLFSFLISTSNTQHAYLEYHSSESGAATTPSFTIEWQ